jgi:hypothetical protein
MKKKKHQILWAAALLLLVVFFGLALALDAAYRGERTENHLPMNGHEDVPGEFTPVTVTLRVGATKQIDDQLAITLDQINDSRCPAEVYCIWAGEIAAELTTVNGGKWGSFRLGTSTAPEVDAVGHRFTLMSADLESVKIKIE